jgi:hypothetical protein
MSLSIHLRPSARATRRAPFGIKNFRKPFVTLLAVTAICTATGFGLHVVPLGVLAFCLIPMTLFMPLFFLGSSTAPLALEANDDGLAIEDAKRSEMIPWADIERVSVTRRSGRSMNLTIAFKQQSRSRVLNIMPFAASEIDVVLANATRHLEGIG